MKRICLGDRLVSNRGVTHVVVRRDAIHVDQWGYPSQKAIPQFTIQSLNSGRKRKATLDDILSWVRYGSWTLIKIPKKIQLPQGI